MRWPLARISGPCPDRKNTHANKSSLSQDSFRLHVQNIGIPEFQIGGDGPIGKNQPASLTLPDHQFNGVAEISAGEPIILDLAGPLEIVPGDLQRFFHKACERNHCLLGWSSNHFTWWMENSS